MITSIDPSQEILAIDVLKTLKSSLKHRRKHILQLLQLYGDQALDSTVFNFKMNKFPHLNDKLKP